YRVFGRRSKRTSYDRGRESQRGLNSSTTLIERIKPTVSKMEIIANKKSLTLSKFGDSEREASGKKNFSKDITF
ncbi:hypothetical protein, partial [Streptococcus pneumoniae]